MSRITNNIEKPTRARAGAGFHQQPEMDRVSTRGLNTLKQTKIEFLQVEQNITQLGLTKCQESLYLQVQTSKPKTNTLGLKGNQGIKKKRGKQDKNKRGVIQ